jgi:hypothetical protein
LFIDTFFLTKKLPTHTPAGFDLTAHNSAGVDDATRPRRQGLATVMAIRKNLNGEKIETRMKVFPIRVRRRACRKRSLLAGLVLLLVSSDRDNTLSGPIF